MTSTSKSPASRAKRKSRTLAFPVEFRLRIVVLKAKGPQMIRQPERREGPSAYRISITGETKFRAHNSERIVNEIRMKASK